MIDKDGLRREVRLHALELLMVECMSRLQFVMKLHGATDEQLQKADEGLLDIFRKNGLDFLPPEASDLVMAELEQQIEHLINAARDLRIDREAAAGGS